MRVNGWEFKQAAEQIESVLRDAPRYEPKPEASEADKRHALNRLWRASKPVQADDPVALWLGHRVGLETFADCLRTNVRTLYNDEPPSWHPAMIAKVTGADGTPVTLHRTYLTLDGQKAPVEVPRRFMPGSIKKGCAVRLLPHGVVLGVAEGIETAFAAARLFDVPCWATLTADLLSGWWPPEGIKQVLVFGDNDRAFAGQAAAYSLARRLTAKGLSARVEIPPQIGSDWNDVWLGRGAQAQERSA